MKLVFFDFVNCCLSFRMSSQTSFAEDSQKLLDNLDDVERDDQAGGRREQPALDLGAVGPPPGGRREQPALDLGAVGQPSRRIRSPVMHRPDWMLCGKFLYVISEINKLMQRSIIA